MNHELAKKLKDAGLPIMGCMGCDDHFFGYENDIHNPTLSELIEACGEGFQGLFSPKTPLGDRTQEWVAVQSIGWIEKLDKDSTPYYKSEWSTWICWTGSTPEEAVANLWLELNKK